MWSGPRNISTALMRSWENRPDCSVVDEPFYACYLAETGLEHPCREAILASQSSSRGEVVRQLTTGAVSTPLQYQKHMTHHMPDGMDLAWCDGLRHCFLIRDPAEVIASYLQKMPTVSEESIGIARQARLFDEITAIAGREPVVIDSADVLRTRRGCWRGSAMRWALNGWVTSCCAGRGAPGTATVSGRPTGTRLWRHRPALPATARASRRCPATHSPWPMPWTNTTGDSRIGACARPGGR